MANEKILIIDDEENTLYFLKILFEKHGYRIVTHQNSAEIGVDTIQSIQPDLILLDILMPQLSGLQVLAALKKNESVSKIPVVMLSSCEDADKKIEALKMGAVDYISKPFQKDELLYRVRNVIGCQAIDKKEANQPKRLQDQLEQVSTDEIIPCVDINSPYGYSYKNIASRLNITAEEDITQQLQKLVQENYLEKVFFDVVYLCPNCEHYNMILKEVCPSCLHTQHNYNGTCSYCNEKITEKMLKFKCLNCGRSSVKRELIKKDIFAYKIINFKNSDKQNNLHQSKHNIIKQALQETGIAYLDLDKFKKRISRHILFASDFHHNVTVMSIEIRDEKYHADPIQPARQLDLVRDILLTLKNFLRKYDVISYKNDDTFLLLLPKIHLSMAKILAERIQANSEVSLEIKLASYPEDGYNEEEILAMLEMGIEVVKEKFVP